MTTTDFEAALDRLIAAAGALAVESHDEDLEDALAEARAAVVALAPDRAEARDIIDIRQAADDALQAGIALGRRLPRPSDSSKTESDCRASVDAAWKNFEAALKALEGGEPEDAGAGE